MRLETFIIHQSEKFNKKLMTLGRLFLTAENDVFQFEDEHNIILFRIGFNSFTKGFVINPQHYVVEEK